MTQKTHVVIGVHAALLTNVFFIFAAIGAVFPDIDVGWSYYKTKDGYKPNYKLPKWIGHRGITHSPIPYLILFGCTFFMPILYKIIVESFLIGVATHILADMLNPTGVPIYSFKKKTSLKLLKTRSTAELVILTLLTISLLVVPKQLYQNQLELLDFYISLLHIR